MVFISYALAGLAIYLRSEFLFDHFTLAKTEIIYPKNVRAKVAMDFT